MGRGLGSLQRDILALMARYPGRGGSVSQIAWRVGASYHAAYVALHRLEHRGLVEKWWGPMGPWPGAEEDPYFKGSWRPTPNG